jgi:hypothetical protein
MAVAGSACADDILSYLSGGAVIAAGPVDAAITMHNSSNEIFFVSVSSGVLQASKSTDGGNSFAPTTINSASHTLTNIRKLTLLSRVFETALAFFIADDASGSGIYALYADANGGLSLYSGGKLDDDTSGAVSDFSALPEAQEKFVIFYNKSGVLKYSYVSTSTGTPVLWNSSISSGSQTVSDFQIRERYLPLHEAFVGAFRATTEGGVSTLYAFSLIDHLVSRLDQLDSASTAATSVTSLYTLRDGTMQLVWVNGSRVSVFVDTGIGWVRRLLQTLAFNVGEYIPVTNGQTVVDAILGGQAPVKLYANIDTTEGLSVPLFPLPILRIPGGVVLPSSFLMTALVDDPTGKKFASKSYSFDTSTWTDVLIPSLPQTGVLDAWFSGMIVARFAAVLTQQDGENRVGVFSFDVETLSYEKVLDLDAADATALQGETLPGDLLALLVGQKLYLADTGSFVSESLPDAAQIRSLQTDDGIPRFLVGNDSGWKLAAKRM